MNLSIKCRNCNATNTFDKDSIPTFCSFCGAALPDMQPYVKEALNIAIERERHSMDMEKGEQEIRKQQSRNFKDKADTVITIVFAALMIFILTMMFIVAMK